jgi:hypothetical protein
MFFGPLWVNTIEKLILRGAHNIFSNSIFLLQPIDLSWKMCLVLIYAPVAQLDRVADFESVGRRFDSCRA